MLALQFDWYLLRIVLMRVARNIRHVNIRLFAARMRDVTKMLRTLLAAESGLLALLHWPVVFD